MAAMSKNRALFARDRASASGSIHISSARSGGSRPTMARCSTTEADQADHPVAGDAGLSASRPLRGRQARLHRGAETGAARSARCASISSGSWAGAIGHLQVNPSNVLLHGTDGDGDGKVDLQDSLPDALATSAKFLLDLGYTPGVDWGYEVSVPEELRLSAGRPYDAAADRVLHGAGGEAGQRQALRRCLDRRCFSTRRPARRGRSS